MGKLVISKLFLYKHRFGIGYTLLGIAFIALLFLLPITTPNGLSEAEMSSVVTAAGTSKNSFLNGDIVNLPYHLLQRFSIKIFGLTPFSIKLPSIIIGLFLGFLLILLLNRWFKNNTAIMASVLTVLSSSFLYVTGSGTPLIMIVFWPTLLLWLGSKIQGINKPRPFYSFIFAFALLGSIFTPYLIYLAIFILGFVLLNPHLRFTVKNLPKVPFAIVSVIVFAGCTLIIMNAIKHTSTIADLLFMQDFNIHNYLANIKNALLPVFTWSGTIESTFLAPLIGLPTLALAGIGLISTGKGFLASRNSIATCLIIFTLIISGFKPDYIVLLILPLSILVAHGLKYILNKWYGIFPENPYARVFGIIPIALFMGIIIVSDLSHFVFGYRYNPSVANQFNNDLVLITNNLSDGDTLYIPADTLESNFYQIYAHQDPIIGESRNITVTDQIPSGIPRSAHLATLGKVEENLDAYDISKIITSSKSQGSDRIYLYTVK